jgi:hypothetical protein
MTSEVTGADVNFVHRSYHCVTLTLLDVGKCWQVLPFIIFHETHSSVAASMHRF